MTQRSGTEHTVIPQPWPCSHHVVLLWMRAPTAPKRASVASTARADPCPCSATFFHPRVCQWGLKQKLFCPGCGQQSSCYRLQQLSAVRAALHQARWCWELSQLLAVQLSGLDTIFFFSYCQQELSTADAWSGRFALTLTLLLLPAYHKNCSLLWPWKFSATRRGQLKTRKEEPVTTACSAPTRGFATQHHKTRNVTLQRRQYVATRWSRDSPQQHTSISPHHQSYPGSEWGSNKEMGKKSIIETKYQTYNSM